MTVEDSDGDVREMEFAADITSPVSEVDRDERHRLLSPHDAQDPSFRARFAAEALAERFPDNPEIRKSLGKLRYAQEAHQRLKSRRGRNPLRSLPPRPPTSPRTPGRE